MENIRNPKNLNDDSDGISKNSHLSVDQSRSYICSFCIRGFSNAQALGGHMNIHRRDRAKLRQQLMEDNKDDVESSEVVSLDLNEQQEERKEGEEEAMACDDDQDHQDMDIDVSHGKELGLWAQENKPDINDHGKVMDVSIDGSSSSHNREELDLELRLGQSAVENKKKKT